MPIGQYDQGASDRGLSTKLWLGLNPGACLVDPRQGMFFFEDFFTLNSTDNYTFTNTTPVGSEATFALDATVVDGVAKLSAISTTDREGGQVQWQGPQVIPAAGKTTYFETRLKATATSTSPQFYTGLCSDDTTIIATDAISAPDQVGFYSVTDDNVLVFATEDSTVETVASASPGTLVEDTYVKLGFRINGVDTVDIFVDGEEIVNTTTMDIPEGVVLLPSWVCQSIGTTAPIVHIDWFAVGVS